MIWVILVVLGLALGSFVNAVVWRIREQGKGQRAKGKELSILSGRSRCPHCRHELAAKDLIPVLSWLILRGKCRYCAKPISIQYPLVEAAMAAVFTISYAYWPGGVFGVGEWLLLITWLMVSVGLMALFIYDLKWMLLPNKIIYPTLAVAASGRLVYLLSFESNKFKAIGAWGLSIAVASGFFWLIYQVSKGQWIGYGDVRLGLIIGTVMADPLLSVLVIFTASVLGTVAAIPALAAGRKTMMSRIPFGPFLIAATWLVLLFGSPAVDSYKRLLQ